VVLRARGASLIPLSDRPTTSDKTFSAALAVVINLIVINRNNLDNIYETCREKRFQNFPIIADIALTRVQLPGGIYEQI